MADNSEERRGFCIVCREEGKVLTDEHVIPLALGGCYHLYSVCKTCNSRLGDKVDIHLINHWAVVASRHSNRLEGRSHKIPNPLTGAGYLEDGSKVSMVEDDGKLTARFLPSPPVFNSTDDGYCSVSFSVDAKDERHIPEICNKVLRRNGIDPSKCRVESKQIIRNVKNPVVSMQIEFDIAKYLIGMLKIAYEFTCDCFPDYINDARSVSYAHILENADLEAMKSVPVCNAGFTDCSLLKPLKDLLDISNNKRHYLVLVNGNGRLYCCVSLFGNIWSVIEMADREYVSDKDVMLIAVNDFKDKTFRRFTLPELADAAQSSIQTDFSFDSDTESYLHEQIGKSPISFAVNYNGDTIVYKSDKTPLCTVNDLIKSLPENLVDTKQSASGDISHVYSIPHGHYVLLQPEGRLLEMRTFVIHALYSRV